ncbi:glycosyltransferase [Halieaceae bacterium IMCC14734]|uniref:Glycosyltransferase n=1 Tax=Candidatus Litorirhabdus singularis TaxID=2518993 RepID=A0ABT3TEI7_9GAMM|nr:glycosyltransferase [Candidatus Litorirhabdus singularis]MCX2980595.1 glycosyltransferase [Candidatus Litorirhabdus singularis]
MKKLLFITPELPFPAQSGGKVKSLKLLQTLAERYEVTLACPLKLEDASYLEEFYTISPCRNHLHDALHIPRSFGNLARSYLSRIPLNVLRSHSPQLQAGIAALAGEQDIVFLDHYEVFSYLPPAYDGLTVYHAHNAYFKMWQRFAELPGNPAMRFAAWLEARRVKKYETSVAQLTDLTFAAPNDARELADLGVDAAKLHQTFHLGDDQQLELPDLLHAATSKKLMYVGFLGWEPNAQGLLWFIEQVWPKLVKRHPELRFDIVGKNPDQRLQAAAANWEGISLKGFVPDLQEIYRDSRVSVAPLLFGSGMKVKVLDAMARGIPTVTTSVGAEGIDVEHGKHLLVADKPHDMANAVDRLLTDPQLWQRLQLNSRDLIRRRYTWSALFKQMHRTLDMGLRNNGSDNGVPEARYLQHAG